MSQLFSGKDIFCFRSHLVAFQKIWSHLVAFSVHYLNTPVVKFNHLIDKSFNSHQEYTVATSPAISARGTKKDSRKLSFFMPIVFDSLGA